MFQVTEEEHCEESVFLLALNLVDRFLSMVDVKKSQLQLLGCVTLLLASKMRQSRPLTVDRLVYFSDYSISAAEIRVSLSFCASGSLSACFGSLVGSHLATNFMSK